MTGTAVTDKRRVDIDETTRLFEQEVRSSVAHLCATTHPKILASHADRLEELRDRIREEKRAVHGTGREARATELLGFQCLAEALAQEARMWIALREGRAHDAWFHVVEAEDNACLMLRTSAGGDLRSHLEGRYQQLQQILFPRNMMFLSAGFEHDEGKCTICDAPVSACPHIRGRIYDGQLCAEYGYQVIRGNHVAMVQVPMDKRCYLDRHKPQNEEWVDRLTGEITPCSEKDDAQDFVVRGTIMSMRLPVGAEL